MINPIQFKTVQIVTNAVGAGSYNFQRQVKIYGYSYSSQGGAGSVQLSHLRPPSAVVPGTNVYFGQDNIYAGSNVSTIKMYDGFFVSTSELYYLTVGAVSHLITVYFNFDGE